jgi:hypothetical protein
MAQHVRVSLEAKLGSLSSALHPGKSRRRGRSAAF